LSTIIPGSGQIYNKKYWKAPIVWGALAGMGYLILSNNDKYHAYRTALKVRSDNDPSTIDPYAEVYSEDNLSVLSDYYRRNRDLSYLGVTAVYLLNIVDAIVDGHLQEFDVNDNLTFKFTPYYAYGMGSESGLRISMFIR
jgi:calcineurin-like phosphoesterase family protein